MGKISKTFASDSPAEKIRQALHQHNLSPNKARLTQKDLAKKIGVTESTLSRWLSGERMPNERKLAILAEVLDAPDLLKPRGSFIEYRIDGKEAHGVEWLQFIPPHFRPEQVPEMNTGFEIFKSFFVNNQPTSKVLQGYPDRDVTFLYNSFKSVLRANCLQIVHVPQSETLEAQLKMAFGNKLRKVIVADIPPNCDCSPIRAEFVAWLFAIRVLPALTQLKYIGLGYGYTLLRIPEIAIPHHQAFTGVNWIPLSAIHYDYSPDKSETTIASKIPSANYLTRRLQNKYPSSLGWHRRYYRDKEHMRLTHLDDYQIFSAQTKNLQSIITSVNGFGRKSFDDPIPPKTTQWRTSDYIPLANMEEVYEAITRKFKSEKVKHEVGGEILGVFFDDRGKQIRLVDSKDEENLSPGDDDFRVYLPDFHSAFFQIDLQILEELCRISSVWVVASRIYKAKPIYHLLDSKKVNALVIDREIAEELLRLKAEADKKPQ